MRFRILGPIEVWRDGHQVALGGPQQRALLAALLLDADRVVSAERLIAEIWGEQPPPDVRGLLRGCVARLRRALRVGAADGEPEALLTRGPGYVLQVAPGEFDLRRFEELGAEAGQALAGGNRDGLALAADLLHEALGLWRGPALDGLPPGVLDAQAARLEEQRLAVLEQRVDTDLRLGRHTTLIGELSHLVHAHPLRERLWAQLMLALYAADRQADALATYRQVRDILIDQLGMEPGPTLRHVEHAILTGEDAYAAYGRAHPAPVPREPAHRPADARPRFVTPAQLPPAAAAFTGRRDQLTRLDGLLPEQTSTVVIAAVTGSAGVGKTTLAVRWAHQVRDRFPDGQLYLNLRGYGRGAPTRPIDALAGLLNAIGVPADKVPTDTEQAAGLYRSALADRRVLVLLDNAASADQVRPLLPASPGSLVLITSRDRLGGLIVQEGAHRLALDVLTPDEAHALLRTLLGHDRVDLEPDATAELARLCAHLPLALRIAAAALDDDPGQTIAGYAAELRTSERLDALAVGGDEDTAVRAAFDLSYATLAPDAQRLFRLLGLVPGPDFTPDAAAALTAATPTAARPLLDRLAGAHLIGRPAPGRYAFHDLLRDYAADRASREDSDAQRNAALRRLLDWYLYTADGAARLLYPGKPLLPVDTEQAGSARIFDDHAEAVAWLDAERPNLVAVLRHSAAHGPHRTACLLADALRGYFWLRRAAVDWLAVAHAGLAAAEAERDPDAQVAAHLSLGDGHRCQGRYEQAIEHYARAVAITDRTGWVEGRASVLGNLGLAHWQLGRLREATDTYARALELNRRANRLAGQAANLGNLGLVHQDLGELDKAVDHYGQALVLSRKLGSRGGEAVGLGNLGIAYHLLGRLDDAESHLTSALELCRQLGDPGAEAEALRYLAEIHRDAGRPTQARETAEAALALARDNGDPRWIAETLTTLAGVRDQAGHHAQAIEDYSEALGFLHGSRTRNAEVAALAGRAVAYHHANRLDCALADARQALTLARQAGLRLHEGQALTALARITGAAGQPDAAIRLAEQALAQHRESGHRLGQARTLVILGNLLRRTGGMEAARPRWEEACDLFTAIGSPEAAEVQSVLGAGVT